MGTKRRPDGDPKRAIAYIRASTEDQKLTPDAQRADILAWAAREGVLIVAWHIDQGVCSADEIADRPALIAALGELREANAGLLVVARRDRLARDVYVAGTIERAVAQCGARVVSAVGVANGDTAEDRFLRAILDAVAAYERDLIRARTKAALAAKRRRGEHTGGAPPYGYRVVPSAAPVKPGEEAVLLIEEEPAEQAVIVQARELDRQGLSLGAISRELAWRGHVSRGGKPFLSQQIVRILKESGAAPVADAAE